jgi:cytochrome c-type biogenesis protein CcsB
MSVTVLNAAAALLLGIVLIIRSISVRFVALLGTYDSLLFYALCLLAIAVVYDRQRRYSPRPILRFGVTVLAFALAALASSPLVESAAKPPIPALRSAWLVLHVSLAFIGEALFAFAFVTALASLGARARRDDDRIRELDRLTYTGIALGYPVFTLGALVFGAVWAEAAWGRWWSWDPKETWALITWLVYTAFLHLRFVKKVSSKTLAWLSVLGFACTLFTFFGVNYLLSGLHSYR